MTSEIYLDYNATTPCDPRVVEKMLPFFTDFPANPSSGHSPGRRAERAVREAREAVGTAIGAHASEIVFTSGATESINLAICGFARRQKHHSDRNRIALTPVEHKAVLETCGHLENDHLQIVVLPVDLDGVILLDEAAKLIDERTLLASVQSANNEIGVLQPIAELVEICHSHGVVVHCDAAQSVGKVAVSVGASGVDLLSFSSHKMYGPKGVGALFIRGGARLAALAPMLEGGGQENGLRSGTLNVPGIVGFGEACRISVIEQPTDERRIRALRDRLEAALLALSTSYRVNAHRAHRLPNTSSISFSGIEADALLANLPTLALSLGSACNSGSIGPSHVLSAIGLSALEAYSTVRFSLGKYSTESEIDLTATEVASALNVLVPEANVSEPD